MKSNLLRASLIAVIAAASAAAQHTDGLTAKVPFSFIVNGRKVPAGDVTIGRTFSSVALIVRSNGQAGAIAMTQSTDQNQSQAAPKLVFHQYGGVYFLAEVWDAQYAHKLATGSRERELSARVRGENQSIALTLR